MGLPVANNIQPRSTHQYAGCFKTLRCRTDFLQYSFLPFVVKELNKLDSDIKNIDSCGIFLKKLLTFIWPERNIIHGIYESF